jgi:hypothetical protein
VQLLGEVAVEAVKIDQLSRGVDLGLAIIECTLSPNDSMEMTLTWMTVFDCPSMVVALSWLLYLVAMRSATLRKRSMRSCSGTFSHFAFASIEASIAFVTSSGVAW